MQSQETQLSELMSLGKELTTAFEGTQEAELTEKCARIISEIRHLQQKQREQLKQQIQGKFTPQLVYFDWDSTHKPMYNKYFFFLERVRCKYQSSILIFILHFGPNTLKNDLDATR